jgi:hypothetical protein
MNKSEEHTKWWKNPAIMVPSCATILAAIIGTPLLIPVFQGVKKTPDNTNFSSLVNSLSAPKTSTTIQKDLRPLQPLETGKGLNDLPNGVYFFAGPSAIVYQIQDPKATLIQASNKLLTNYSFEMQKDVNQNYVVGFISDESYANISTTSSNHSTPVILFPNRWASATHVVAIPFGGISTIKTRDINADQKTNISVLDIVLTKVQDATSHI